MSRYDLKFGASWLSDLGARSTRPPEIEIAQRKGEFKDIPGKDGAEYIDYGSYDNVEFERDISFVGTISATAQQKVDALIDSFAYLQGYQSFEDTDHPDMVTEAVLMNFGDVNKQLRTLRSAILRFNRKPFWYSKDGLIETEYGYSAAHAGVTLTNPFPASSRPLIRVAIAPYVVSQTVDFDLVVNDMTYTIDDIQLTSADTNNSVIFDFENETVYMLNHRTGVKTPIDIDIRRNDGFGTGENTVSVTSRLGSVSVYITPKWRRL